MKAFSLFIFQGESDIHLEKAFLKEKKSDLEVAKFKSFFQDI